MAQSVELLLDAEADAAVRAQWAALAAASLPSELRTRPRAGHPGDVHHAPHLTLYAGDRIDAEADAGLPSVLAGLDLELVVGSTLVFGPRRGGCVVVRQVPATSALLDVQRTVAQLCGASPYGQFGPGRWSPHVTIARRVPLEDLGRVVKILGDSTVEAVVRHARRWDGTAKTAWSLV